MEDTIWGSTYGSTAAIQAAFDRFGPEYHDAIVASGAPAGAAAALRPHLATDAQGLDLGCGSGALGQALHGAGLVMPLDGIDLSPGMIALAAQTGCYRRLHRANLLLKAGLPQLEPYDFVITMGLVGDYVPYYLALPYAVSLLKPGGHIGFAVESRSTPWRALEELAGKLGLTVLSETVLPVTETQLVPQTYYFYAARLASAR